MAVLQRLCTPLVCTWPIWTFLVVVALYYLLVQELKIREEVLQITEAEFLPAEAAPVEARKLQLPDYWRKRDYWQGEAWYRARLQLNVPPDRLWGIYLPSVGTNAAVYLNGRLLGTGGRMDAPPARNDFRPLYFTISNGVLRPSANIIEIRVVADTACSGYLGPISLGPDQLLRSVYERGRFIRVTLVRFIFASLLVSLFYVSVLAWKTRDVIYFHFAGVLAAASLFLSSVVVSESPFPGWWWDWVRMMGTGWLVVFLILFLHRFNARVRPRLERLLLGWAVIGSLVLLLTPLEWKYIVGSYAWDVLTIFWGIYAFAFAVRESVRSRRSEQFAMALSIGVMLAAGVRDWLVYNDDPGAFHGTLFIYAIVYPLAVFAWILLQRFVMALYEAKTLNMQLEQRVREKEAELQESYRKLVDSKKRQALAEERERIMCDMHDGIGGHLITASAAAKRREDSELAEMLDSALTDLRLMIDSFEPVYDDLTTVLGLVRMRLEKRVKNHGLTFNWKMGDIFELPSMDPHQVLHIMRIVEEAVTNVIKHAGARTITIETYNEERAGEAGVSVEVRDDGKGIGSDRSAGRGLGNMSKRAKAIGGALTIENADPGSVVKLWLRCA